MLVRIRKAENGTNGGYILKYNVGFIPHVNDVDAPLIYADYYYIKALL